MWYGFSMARATSNAAPARGEARREALLTQLVELILAQGFAAASVEDLARELRCSKTTLYGIADSKEGIILAAVRRFFRHAAARVDGRLLRDDGDAVEQIRTYLTAIATELAPASAAFFADLDGWPSTHQIYQENTRAAADRVQELVRAAAPQGSAMDTLFIGAVAAQVMEAIQRGDIESSTRLDDAAAYRALADLIVRNLESAREGAA